MAKVAQEMVKKAGVNLDELVELLVNNAAAKLTTYYLLHHFAREPHRDGRGDD